MNSTEPWMHGPLDPALNSDIKPKPDWQIPDQLLNDYTPEALLGSKHSVRTLLAHKHDGTKVIIKELRLHQLTHWKPHELFEREIQTLERLQHPRIPRLLDHLMFESQDTHGTQLSLYAISEHMPGISLQDKLNSGWRPDEQTVRALAREVLTTLIYLHQRSPAVIHRDLKPANLILDQDKVYLVDFGAVRDTLRQQRGSTVVGTFGYMAPEQFLGQALPQTDLYGLGACLLHLLCGRSPSELPYQNLQLCFEPDYQGALGPWLKRMLAYQPNERFQSAEEALAALDQPLPFSPAPLSEVPAGSTLKVQQWDDVIQFEASSGWDRSSLIWLGSGSYLALIAILFAIQTSVPIGLSLSLIVTALGCQLILLSRLSRRSELLLSPSELHLSQYNYLGRIRSVRRIPYAQLVSFKITQDPEPPHHQVLRLRLRDGSSIDCFDFCADIEKRWLYQQIAPRLLPRLPQLMLNQALEDTVFQQDQQAIEP